MLVDYVSMASPKSCEVSFPLKKAEHEIKQPFSRQPRFKFKYKVLE